MLVSLTVGKVDAGVAVLLTEDKRLIEFPSILLPPDISSGSIVDITVSRNHKSESDAAQKFHALQSTIFRTFGQRTPTAPILRCRNATQTSVVLEWDPIDIATAELRGLTLFRNGSKAGTIPKPTDVHSTKLSGLAVDTEYVFHLVLRTSAGTYTSEKLKVTTHKMTDLSGITITPGHMPAALRESLSTTVERIGAKLVDSVRIDTTHFVCTEGRGPNWEKAVEMNIPVVVPDWVKGCEREGRIVGVRGYYLNADPRLRQLGPGSGGGAQGSSTPQVRSPPLPSPRTEVTPPTPERKTLSRSPVGGSRSPPPRPPPKDREESEGSEASSTGATKAASEPEQKTQASDEQKVRTEQLKPSVAEESADDDDDSDSDDDSEEEDAQNGADAKAAEAGLTVREKPAQGQAATVEDAEDDGASFQEVDL